MALFQDLIVSIARWGEHGEASVEEANRQIVRLFRLGVFHETMVLADQPWSRPYGNTENHTESGMLIQAALFTPKGIGAIRWDTEEFENSRRNGTLEADAVVKFRPVQNCRAAVRGFLHQHAQALIESLCREYGLPVQRQP
ncbi:MAG: hypothetical protein QM811_19755 [Pirellulales bacterium]